MRTPKEYTTYLKKRTITKEMLEDCLYSVNKRAKNCRDKIRSYKRYDVYEYVDTYRDRMDTYYEQKEILLDLIKPVCIHKEIQGYERKRILDTDPTYRKHLKGNHFVWENKFYNKEIHDYTYFGDIELKECPIYRYYLFYELGKHSFHRPIYSPKSYDLEIKEIKNLHTKGHEILDLISPQFVKKVIELIESGTYHLVLE